MYETNAKYSKKCASTDFLYIFYNFIKTVRRRENYNLLSGGRKSHNDRERERGRERGRRGGATYSNGIPTSTGIYLVIGNITEEKFGDSS